MKRGGGGGGGRGGGGGVKQTQHGERMKKESNIKIQNIMKQNKDEKHTLSPMGVCECVCGLPAGAPLCSDRTRFYNI